MFILNLIQRKTGLRKKGLHGDTLVAVEPAARTASAASQRQLPPAALRMRDVARADARADAAAERFEANALAVATAMSLADAAETPASNSDSY